ncbi:MAG: GAF domain-containing protein [Anaerolineae bacterium]
MRELLRTLIIEDLQDDTELVVYELRKAGYEVTYERVDTPDALITALESKSWDIILSDHSMPGFSGTSALKFVRERAGDIPFIVVSGSISEDAAVSMMKAGAHDYFYKGNIARLVPAVQRELHEAQERMQREWAEKQLREAEERLAKVFRVSPSAIAISTLAEGVFIDVNSSFLDLTGYQRAEVVGRSSLDIQLWVDTDKREALLRRVRDETTVRDFVTSFRLKSGEVRDVLLSCEKLEFGGVECILSVFFDVTERNRATEAIRRYSERLRTLHSIDQSILAAQSPVEVAQAVLGSLHSLLPCSHAAVVAHDTERQTASVVAVYSRDAATALQPGKAIAMPGGDQPLSKTLAESDAALLSDLERLLYAEGVREYSYFPLSARGRIIGSLVVGSKRQSASPEEIEIVHELGAQLAVAWENARLSSTVLRQVKALDTLRRASLQLTSSLDLQIILDTVLDYATELVSSDSAHIFLYRDDQLIFGAAFFDGAHQRQPYAVPRMDGITSTVARTGEMVVIPDVNADPLYGGWQWGGAILGLPLRMGDEINGVLTLAFTQPHPFDDDTVRVLTLLADHAALAVHNAQLYTRIQQHAGELEAHVAARTEELQLAKEHVEAILDNSSDTIIVLNTDGTIQQTNPAFRELFGYGDEVVGKPFAALAKPDFAEVLNVVFGAVVETRALTAGGIWYSCACWTHGITPPRAVRHRQRAAARRRVQPARHHRPQADRRRAAQGAGAGEGIERAEAALQFDGVARVPHAARRDPLVQRDAPELLSAHERRTARSASHPRADTGAAPDLAARRFPDDQQSRPDGRAVHPGAGRRARSVPGYCRRIPDDRRIVPAGIRRAGRLPDAFARREADAAGDFKSALERRQVFSCWRHDPAAGGV